MNNAYYRIGRSTVFPVSSGRASHFAFMGQAVLKAKLFYLLLSLILLAGPHAYAQESDISINSFRAIASSPRTLAVEVDCSNDGSRGVIHIGGVAQSQNGAMQFYEFAPVVVPVGKHVRVIVSGETALTDAQQQPGVLIFTLKQEGKPPFIRQSFPFSHSWALIPPIRAARNIDSRNTDTFRQPPLYALKDAFNEGDFASMDAMVMKLNDPSELDSNGDWKIGELEAAMESQFKFQDRNWTRNKERINRWKAFNQRSPGAAITEAIYWITYARSIRGQGEEVNRDPFARKVFRKYMKAGEDALIESKNYASMIPLWYEIYLEIAKDTGKGDVFIEKLFLEGISRHPYYRPLYVEMAMHWSSHNGKPNWEKVDDVAETAVTKTQERDGISNYAVLYRAISNQQPIGFEVLEESRASWPRMRKGFEDLTRRYPGSYNLNSFAAYACRAGDKETFLKVWMQIGDQINMFAWPSNYSPDLCKRRFLIYT